MDKAENVKGSAVAPNTRYYVDGDWTWIGYNRKKNAGRPVTDKGNVVKATLGGRMLIEGDFINFTAYAPTAE